MKVILKTHQFTRILLDNQVRVWETSDANILSNLIKDDPV